MSIFDGIDFTTLSCKRAEKNIADDIDRKYVITRLEFEDSLGLPVFAVRSSYSVDGHLQTILDDAIKISCDNFKKDLRSRLRSFGQHDVSEELKKDLDIIERLFHTAPDEVKRVY